MPDDNNILLERSLRAVYGRALGVVARLSGDLDAAEDAVQYAAEQAIKAWKAALPESPAAWLIRVARNHLIDRARRGQLHMRSMAQLQPLVDEASSHDATSGTEDGLLQLILVCAHPALALEAQLVLILRVVLGFDVSATARALLLSEDAVKKRLVRAKTTIRDAGIAFSQPTVNEYDTRMPMACDALYLMFNEGYSRPTADSSINLCAEAMRLTRQLASLERDNRDVRSLLALMLFGAGRLSARYDANGEFVPLDRQDRSLWDQGLIREGLAILDSVFQRRLPPTSLQLQAAISACHCREREVAQTDWAEIAALYERLERLDPSPVVRINRAAALARQGQVEEAAARLDALAGQAAVRNYLPYYTARGFVLELQGRVHEAQTAYSKAATLIEESPERRFLEDKALIAAVLK